MTRIWELIAYLGRYGGQTAHACLDMPMTDLHSLALAVDTLVRQEGKALGGPGDG